ncbi:hypothetical protein [Photobacterium kishitanii]|uniref:hypothetical protein n=1 Tax=Photobacterium kishitanii TaxID=318456 RepID=UPI002738DD23|nr:hypothetical protein [Photobacterium kishitanii]
MYYCYLFEAKSIQDYLFQSNKLKDVIAASERLDRLIDSTKDSVLDQVLKAAELESDLLTVMLILSTRSIFYAVKVVLFMRIASNKPHLLACAQHGH